MGNDQQGRDEEIAALKAELERVKRQEFQRGYLIACCNIDQMHNHPEIAFDVLAELGISRTEMKAMGFDEYDMKALRRIEKSRSSDSLYRDGRKGKRRE